MSSAPVFIHAGAHRTGTSSFQMCLHANREIIEKAGFAAAYPARDGIATGNLALRLPGPRHMQGEFPAFVDKARRHLNSVQVGHDKPLILSEENIPGRMLHFFQGQFYPAAEQRLMVLRDALGARDIKRLILVVRSYDEICVSGFRKRAEDNMVQPFETQRDKMLNLDRGWVEIVTLMKDILQPSEFLVIPYEARGTSTSLLHCLVPKLPLTKLREPEKSLNVSATDAALSALQSVYRKGQKLPRHQWRRIIQAYAGDKTRRGFAEFTSEQSQKMRKRYLVDLVKLRQMSDIKFTL